MNTIEDETPESLDDLLAEFAGTIDAKALAEVETIGRAIVKRMDLTPGLAGLSARIEKFLVDLRSEYDSRPFAG